jgi:hypothetical protein
MVLLLSYFLLSYIPPFLFLFPFSMLHLGVLCMYTCVAKHEHTLKGSTRGQLGY